jgi:hypothetical protein
MRDRTFRSNSALWAWLPFAGLRAVIHFRLDRLHQLAHGLDLLEKVFTVQLDGVLLLQLPLQPLQVSLVRQAGISTEYGYQLVWLTANASLEEIKQHSLGLHIGQLDLEALGDHFLDVFLDVLR